MNTKRDYSRSWGKEKLLTGILLGLMDNPLEEGMSLRQVFYQKIPYLEENSPKSWIREYPNWGNLLYDGLTKVASDLFLEGRFSYAQAGIIDNSGANEYIYEKYRGARKRMPPDEECQSKYPVEIWVENNATYNALIPLFHWSNRDESYYRKVNIVSGKGFAKSQQIEEFERERSSYVKLILSLNDFDPAGYCMATHDLPKRFKQRGIDTEVIHIGIHPYQIPEERRRVSLTTFKGKLAKGFIKQFGEEYPMVKRGFGYELQALTPSEIRNLVLRNIDIVIDNLGEISS